jgi:hypothetical protein
MELAENTAYADIAKIGVDTALRYIENASRLSDLGYSPILYTDGKPNPINRTITKQAYEFMPVYEAILRKVITQMVSGKIPNADHIGLLRMDNIIDKAPLSAYGKSFGSYYEYILISDLEAEYIAIATGTSKETVISRHEQHNKDLAREGEERRDTYEDIFAEGMARYFQVGYA